MKKYQENKAAKAKKQQIKGFESDEEDDSNKQTQNVKNSSLNYIKKELDQQEGNVEHQEVNNYEENTNNYKNNSSSNYNTSNTNTKSFDYETKIIEDIIAPTGITMKPSDNQLKDFVRKIKTLDKEFIFNKIGEKVSIYENNDPTSFKIVHKSVYVIEAILINKVDDFFYNSFSNCVSTFYDMKNFYAGQNNAKKLIDTLNNIIFLLTGKQEGQKVVSEVNNKPQTNNLLDMGSSNENSKIPEKKINKFIKKDNNTNNTNNNQTNLLDLDISDNKTQEPVSVVNEKPGFGFIKKKNANETAPNNVNTSNVNTSTQNQTQGQGNTKPGFSFIKNKANTNTSNNNQANTNNTKKGDINFDEIFAPTQNNPISSNATLINSMDTLDLTKVISPGVNEIQDFKPKTPTIDFSSLDNIYGEKFNNNPNQPNQPNNMNNVNMNMTNIPNYNAPNMNMQYNNQNNNMYNNQNMNQMNMNNMNNYQNSQNNSQPKKKREDTFDFVDDLFKKK